MASIGRKSSWEICMNQWIFRYTCLLACVIAPPSLAAEVLRGSVTDRSGAVVQGASVQLLAGGHTVAETKTDINGEFALAAPTTARAEEAYTILAAASGFVPASQSIRIAEFGSRRVALVLEIAPYRQSVEIHTSTPANESLLDMSGVRESAAKDPGEALTALDGVWKIRKAGIANDLVIRGFQQNNINVLVDGSRTYGACPSHMDPPAQHIDFAEVDRVEVSKGAFDVTNQPGRGCQHHHEKPRLGLQCQTVVQRGIVRLLQSEHHGLLRQPDLPSAGWLLIPNLGSLQRRLRPPLHRLRSLQRQRQATKVP
jgi:hypothetical protein